MDRSFASRIVRFPLPFDPARGNQAIRDCGDPADPLADLVSGAAGCSPYLAGLVRRGHGLVARLAAATPEAVMSDLLDEVAEAPDSGLAATLRGAKARAALLTALADLGGVWSLTEVTGALSAFADACVARALAAALAPVVARGRLPGMTDNDLSTGAGMVVLAMGKLGAGELNFSSDIDLICLFDETRFAPADVAAARVGYVRATRAMCALLSDVRADGYVFRTDLRLRPDPGATAVCLSMEAAERYYESLGRTWERAAYIKARPAAGDVAAGARYLTRLGPFVWRRHLDFAAIRDAHDMRLAIRRAKGFGDRIEVPGHDLKLGRGGIREIEFFTQTRQIIAGGRDASLRVRGTVEGLSRLAAAGWIDGTAADEMSQDYATLREAEHRLQMVADAQTHTVPAHGDGVARAAGLSGMAPDAWTAMLRGTLGRVAGRAEAFFAPQARSSAPAGPALTPDQASIVAGWRAAPALRSDRAQAIFARLSPALLTRLLSGARPDAALLAFDGFLRGLPAGVQLFSLFEANPALMDLVADIADTAPALAQYLSRNAAVLDAVIGGDFFAPWPGTDALRTDLATRLADQPDHERQLDLARAWARDWHFRIGVHHLRGLTEAPEAGARYADLARAVVGAIWPAVGATFALRHGPSPGRGAVVLALGSLGTGWSTARSDLDLIAIYDPGDAAASDGPRPLSAGAYYARLTQALVTALSAPMARGKLYDVDMRLRPSGRQGPVATSLSAFDAYQRDTAWTWEHMALTRAVVLAGPADLRADVEAVLDAVRCRPRDAAAVLADVADMRARLPAAAPSPWDPQAGPGRLQDVGLLATGLALLARSAARDVPGQVADAAASGAVPADVAARLADRHETLMRLRTVSRLLNGDVIDPAALGDGGIAMLLREMAAPDIATLSRRLDAAGVQAARDVAAVLGTGGDTA